jgi:type I restriction enzyme S subunit
MKSEMKQTVIDEIPADWEVVKLGDIISDLKSGVSVNSEDKRIQTPGEIGILKTSAVANGHFLPHQHKLVIEKDVQRAKLNPVEGSILVSRMNTPALVGDSCYIDKDYPDLFIPDRLWMTVFNPKKEISSRWLSFVLVSDSFKEIIKSTATGTSNSMKNISKGSFLSLEVLLPPLPEQRKIAEILSTVNDKMAVIDEQLAQTQELKKGLMQRLLTKGIGHTAFKDSPLGEIPEAWEIKTLEQLVDAKRNIRYGIVQTGENLTEGIPCLRVADFNSRVFKLDNMIRTSPEISAGYPSTILKRNDIVFPLRGRIGEVRLVSEDIEGINLTRGIALISTSIKIKAEYLLWQLLSPAVHKEIMLKVNGTTLQEIPITGLKKVLVPVAPESEQLQIAAILSTVEDKISVLTDKKAQYQELKRGLMQQLLTGQRRVKLPQEEEALA